jgi:RNA-directed DNA polymerase
VTENPGKKTSGVEGELWETPEKKAHAVARIGRGRGYRPAPLRRIYLPKQNRQQRPLSIPTLPDRARQAVSRQALQPIAATTADEDSYGVRPKRRGAEAIDQCCKGLRQNTSATWIWDGDIQGLFATIGLAWVETPIPMNTRVLSTWRRSGVLDRGALFPTTAGVPPGGIISPVISTMGLDELEAVVQGGHWSRRAHHMNSGRGADDVIVTAHAREVLDHTVLPRIDACLAARGVRLSPTKPVSTPISQGFDF